MISDLGLPGEDGYALCQWVRARPPPPRAPPVIAFTALSDRLATKAAGFVAHVEKPIDFPKLFGAIDSVLTDAERPS